MSLNPVAYAQDRSEAVVRIAVAQPLVVPGEPAINLERMRPMVAAAARAQADLVLFSECGLTGYDLRGVGLGSAISLDSPLLSVIGELAVHHRLAIVQGFYERHADGVFNTAVAFLPDGVRVVQRKHRIIDHERDHTPVRSAPRRRESFTIAGLNAAMLICADNGIENIHRELATSGCGLVLSLTAGLGDASWALREEDLARSAGLEQLRSKAMSLCFVDPRAAVEWGMAMAACNQAGFVESIGYFQPGHSSVMDRDGRCCALIPGVAVADHLRPQLAIGSIRRPDSVAQEARHA